MYLIIFRFLFHFRIKKSFKEFMQNQKIKLIVNGKPIKQIGNFTSFVNINSAEQLLPTPNETIKTANESALNTNLNEVPSSPPPEDFMDNFKSELAKLPAKKVREFRKLQPEHDLNQTPTMKVFGIGHRCHICFKPFKSRDELLLHREQSNHQLNVCEQIQQTPESLRPLKAFELSFLGSDDEDDEAIRKRVSEVKRIQPIKCNFCPREFSQKSFLKKHEDKHRDKNDAAIKTRPSQGARATVNSFKCSVC